MSIRPLPHRIIHGADYNPDQWEDTPDIIDDDMRLMPMAGLTGVALGIFSWTRLEPREGEFDFDWMARLLDRLQGAGVGVWLATPSGAKPNWMAEQYPEIRRCQPSGNREHQAGRHNHCYTSPVYRDKVATINGRLAQRFGQHEAVQLWHISNEYGGSCSCSLCFTAFHGWLETQYGTVDAMNRAYWGRFWSKWFDRFDQITYIDGSISQLHVDWRRFVSHQTADFMAAEVAAIRPHSDRPVTTNLMGTYEELDYAQLAAVSDVVGWDAYPDWHGTLRQADNGNYTADISDFSDEMKSAAEMGYLHDLTRGLKPGKPFLLMESTPSNINWRGSSRLKEPGVNRLAGLQAVAHGADAVAYFQWRKGRGGCETFHGAIVDHVGHEHTRVFREVAALGKDLAALSSLAGSVPTPQVALIHDWEVRWHYDLWKHARNVDKDYVAQGVALYRHLWRRSIAVDVVASTADWSPYRVVVAPALYAIKPGVAEALEVFVRRGGTLLLTAMCGMVDHHDLAFTTGRPGPLRGLAGVWIEEMDACDPGACGLAATTVGVNFGLATSHRGGQFIELAHVEGAEVLATFTDGWHAGYPAITRNRVGHGQVVWCGTRPDPALCDVLIGGVVRENRLMPALPDLPVGITAQQRGSHLFVLNWTRAVHHLVLPSGWRDALAGNAPVSSLDLGPWDVRILTTEG